MNRRNFVTLFRQGGAVAPHVGNGSGSQLPPIFARRSNSGLEPFVPSDDNPWDYMKAAHLLRRTLVGPTDQEIRTAVAEGLDATVDRLLAPFTPANDDIAAWAGQDPQIRPPDPSTPEYTTYLQNLQLHREQLLRWWLRTIATSPVSIQEKLTYFWHNHFTSELQVVNFSEFMLTQNQLLRTNILGNFKQFVKMVTKDVAMLIYLDGIKNFKSGTRDNINENYARELMELFTMGVVDWDGSANYTQTDISEAARALSGYSGTPSSKGASYSGLASQFIPSRWDSGSKTFLGSTGNWNADDVVDIIFDKRALQVSRFICGKLYRALVYDVIDPVVVDAMAQTFRNGNWELRPVIVQLLKSAHFFDETNIGALEKSPVEFIVGMIRGMGITDVPDFAAGATSRTGRDLVTRLASLGQNLFDPPNVKGWPGGRTWISTSTLPPRQKFAIDLANARIAVQRVTVYKIDPIAFAKKFPGSAPGPGALRKLTGEMARFLLNTPPSAKEEELLFQTILDGGVDYEWSLDDPAQRADARIRKFLAALVQLAKFELM
jgi:uncharacterized protein (DUF1800 family)